MEQTADYYCRLFSDDPGTAGHPRTLRHEGEPPAQTPSVAQQLTDFFFWTAWAAATERPGTTATYYQQLAP